MLPVPPSLIAAAMAATMAAIYFSFSQFKVGLCSSDALNRQQKGIAARTDTVAAGSSRAQPSLLLICSGWLPAV